MNKKTKQLKRRYALARRRSVRRAKRIARLPMVLIPTVTFGLLLVVSFLTLLFLNGGTPKLQSSNSHIVIIHHDKIEQTVPTSAKTVGEMLARAHVTLNDGDVVEPVASTPIVQDNFRVNVYRAVPVTIVDGTTKTFVYSAATTPRSIAHQANIAVYPEDSLQLLPADNFITEDSIGERVVINRATPINMNLYGAPVLLRTHAATVGALLKEKNIVLHNGDTVEPAMNTALTSGIQVFVIHKGTKIVTVSVPIPMPVQTIEDDSLTFGTTAIRQQGSPGTKVITYQVQLQNGQEVGRTEIQEIVSQQPVTQIIARGKAVQIPSDKQAVMALAGISSGDYGYVDYIISHESGWCPTKLQGQYGDCPAYPPSYIPSNLGYGLGQATPGSKMAPFGGDWQTSAVTQLKWAASYAQGTYHGWANAYNHKVSYGWW